MIRALHRWPGLVALVLVTVLALSGAALSVFPMAERLAAPQAVAGQSVADLAAGVAATHPGLEEIRRSPSGRITAWWFDGGTPGSAEIDPAKCHGCGSCAAECPAMAIELAHFREPQLWAKADALTSEAEPAATNAVM